MNSPLVQQQGPLVIPGYRQWTRLLKALWRQGYPPAIVTECVIIGETP